MYTASYVQTQVEAMKARNAPKADIIRQLSALCLGWPYVWASQGEMCTPKWRRNRIPYCREQKYADMIRDNCPVLSDGAISCDGCKWDGVRCFDCRGFTRWLLAMVGVPLFGGTVTAQWEYGPNWVLKGDIRDMPRGLVCCVFRPSHTGMYTGDGWVRHCGGRKGQVTEEQLPGSPKWERFGIPAGLYTNAELEAAGVKFDPSKNIPTLRKGNSGDEVADLQMLLSAKYGADLDIDGVFGAKTEAAVKAFQRAHGLTADGIVGPKTRAALGVSESLPLEGGRSARESVQWTDSSEGRAAAPDGGAPLGATDEVTLPSVIPIAVAPLRCAQARPARAEPLVPSAALPPLPLRGVAAVRLTGAERERSGVEGPESSAVSQTEMITLPLSDWQSIRAGIMAAYHVLQNYE